MTDLPPEEAADWKTAANEAGLATIFLLAPTSTKERIELAAKMGSGFIYCVSRTGVTGARSEMPTELEALVRDDQGGVRPARGGRIRHIEAGARELRYAVRRRSGGRKRAGQCHSGSRRIGRSGASAGEFVRSLKAGVAAGSNQDVLKRTVRKTDGFDAAEADSDP